MGRCGGSGCGQLPGGGSQCCTSAILEAGRSCVDFSDTACVIPGTGTPSPTSSPTSKPTTSPTKSPTTSPTKSPTTGPTVNPTKSPSKNPTSSPPRIPTNSPTKNPVATLNVVANPGFENTSLSPWHANFNSGEVTPDASQSHSGYQSVLVTGRTAGWNGVEQSLYNRLEAGVQYQLSCWVKLKNAASSFFKLTLRVTKDTGKKYPGIARTIESQEWTKIQGTVVVEPGGTVTALDIYVEGPSSGVEHYVDDVDGLRRRRNVGPRRMLVRVEMLRSGSSRSSTRLLNFTMSIVIITYPRPRRNVGPRRMLVRVEMLRSGSSGSSTRLLNFNTRLLQK